MTRSALRTLLHRLIVAAPLAVAQMGCCPLPKPEAEGNYLAIPDGGLPGSPPLGTTLSAEECSTLCDWNTDAGLFNDLGVWAPARVVNLELPHECRVIAGDGGSSQVLCLDFITRRYECAGGRRPDGLVEPAVARSGDDVARYFARAAHLEAASIDAFLILERELREHGAPDYLITAAARAARDEVRHARITGAIARKGGAEPPVVERSPARGGRSLEEIALENVTEGCVRETMGALVAEWQARHAPSSLRGALGAIARDELRHADLSFAVHDWARTRLSGAEQSRIDDARRATGEDVLAEYAAPIPAILVTDAGLPSPAIAVALAEGARRALWS